MIPDYQGVADSPLGMMLDCQNHFFCHGYWLGRSVGHRLKILTREFYRTHCYVSIKSLFM